MSRQIEEAMIAKRTMLQGAAAALIAPALTGAAAAAETTLRQDDLKPVIVEDGVSFELPGVRIGTAEYREGPTGCSVFHFPEGAVCEVDARGGGPGLFGGYPRIDALFLSGGSLYGLEVGSGIASTILAQRKKTSVKDIAFVSGAIIYDFLRRDTLVYPDKRLGAAAYLAAVPGRYPVGARGAGSRPPSVNSGPNASCPTAAARAARSASSAPRLSASLQSSIRSARFLPRTAGCCAATSTGKPVSVIRWMILSGTTRKKSALLTVPAGGHTTITAVIVDKKIPAVELRQFGRQIHAAMAQVIRPFHTPLDGDVLFSVFVGEEPLGFPRR